MDQSEHTFCNAQLHSLIGLVHKVHHKYFVKYNPTTLVLQPDVPGRGWSAIVFRPAATPLSGCGHLHIVVQSDVHSC